MVCSPVQFLSSINTSSAGTSTHLVVHKFLLYFRLSNLFTLKAVTYLGNTEERAIGLVEAETHTVLYLLKTTWQAEKIWLRTKLKKHKNFKYLQEVQQRYITKVEESICQDCFVIFLYSYSFFLIYFT